MRTRSAETVQRVCKAGRHGAVPFRQPQVLYASKVLLRCVGVGFVCTHARASGCADKGYLCAWAVRGAEACARRAAESSELEPQPAALGLARVRAGCVCQCVLVSVELDTRKSARAHAGEKWEEREASATCTHAQTASHTHAGIRY